MVDSVASTGARTAPSQQRSTGRVHWVDTLKAVGIFLVIYGHSGGTGWGIGKWIFSFHMPLFFFLSGYLLKTIPHRPTLRSFASRGVKSLLPAYATFGVVGYVAWVFVLRHFGDSARDAAPAFFPALALLYGTGTPTLFSVVPVVLWFFPCLFTSHLIVYLIHTKLRRWQSSFSALLALVGFFIPSWLALPLELETALVAQWFVFWGHQIRTRTHIVEAVSSSVVGAFFLLALGTTCALLNEQVDMRASEFGNPVLFLGSAVLITVGLLALAMRLPSHRLLDLMAKNTIVLFPLHPLVFSLFSGVYVLLGYPLSIRSNPWIGLLASILNTALLLLGVPLFSKFLPWVYGIESKRRASRAESQAAEHSTSRARMARVEPPVV